MYVGDTNNHRIRTVSPAGAVATLAGSGSSAWADGFGSSASFWFPRGVALSLTGDTLYVADTSNFRIRTVNVVNALVGTLAGVLYLRAWTPLARWPALSSPGASPWTPMGAFLSRMAPATHCVR